ncbi:MAG: class I SAM-dependent methyltransferase [Herpetosiphonaceae bacterium]|nr:class I SAM-dependent methyltransferase [Herpetosiphonaceae bacterium]
MLQTLLDTIARMPQMWNVLRWIAEAGYVQHHRAIREILAPHATPDRCFLDFGCGTGQFAQDFPADRYVGLDPTRPYITFAAHHRLGQFIVSDGTAAGLAAAQFDGALVLGVFHHLSDALAHSCVHELSRLLQPGATLLVIEDVPPPAIWNVPGHIMHWLDRGDNIRSDADYRRLWTPHFTVKRDYGMRSGICDYRVYVLERPLERAA